jgi:hypothetical protein
MRGVVGGQSLRTGTTPSPSLRSSGARTPPPRRMPRAALPHRPARRRRPRPPRRPRPRPGAPEHLLRAAFAGAIFIAAVWVLFGGP